MDIFSKETCVKQPYSLLIHINFVFDIELANMVFATQKKSGDFVDFEVTWTLI